MKSPVIKILALAIAGLLLNPQTLPVDAAPGGSKQDQLTYWDKLPNDTRLWIIIGSVALTCVGVLIGTGKSIKYENDMAKAARKSGNDISNKSPANKEKQLQNSTSSQNQL